jgi:hypothetical protein
MKLFPKLLVLIALGLAACAHGSRQSHDGRYFFFLTANGAGLGPGLEGLWLSDGTDAGTVQLKPFRSNSYFPGRARMGATDFLASTCLYRMRYRSFEAMDEDTSAL